MKHEEISKLRELVWERLLSKAALWNSDALVDAEAMGRTAAKVENTEDLLRHLEKDFDEPRISGAVQTRTLGKAKFAVEHVAKDVAPDRLKFGPCPQFDPRPYLDPETREVYEHPISCSSHGSENASEIPRVRVRSENGNKPGRAQRLYT